MLTDFFQREQVQQAGLLGFEFFDPGREGLFLFAIPSPLLREGFFEFGFEEFAEGRRKAGRFDRVVDHGPDFRLAKAGFLLFSRATVLEIHVGGSVARTMEELFDEMSAAIGAANHAGERMAILSLDQAAATLAQETRSPLEVFYREVRLVSSIMYCPAMDKAAVEEGLEQKFSKATWIPGLARASKQFSFVQIFAQPRQAEIFRIEGRENRPDHRLRFAVDLVLLTISVPSVSEGRP